jgi:hypothetical protein
MRIPDDFKRRPFFYAGIADCVILAAILYWLLGAVPLWTWLCVVGLGTFTIGVTSAQLDAWWARRRRP